MALAPGDVRRAFEDALAGRATWDRSGDIIFYENFEEGLRHWTANIVGSAGNVQNSWLGSRSSSLSVALSAGDGAIVGTTQLLTHLPLPILSPLGLEITFAPVSIGANFGDLQWELDVYDGVNLTQYIIRWSQVNNHLDYWTTGAVFTNFATVPPLYVDTSAPLPYHVGKLVIDPRTSTYRRFILDNVVYTINLVGKSGRIFASVVNTHMDVSATLTSLAATTTNVNLDDLIVTYNEPL